MWLTNPPPDYNVIEGPNGDKAFIHKNANVGNLSIGRFSYVSTGVVLNGPYPIRMGAFCSVAPNVYCFTYETHQINHATASPLRAILGMNVGYADCVEKPEGVTIGNDVYIGDGVRIMAGVTIGDGCVIGARAVVTKNCEPYGIYVGMPARLAKMRFPPNIVAQLHALQWWNWPLEKIQRNVDFFSIDLQQFEGDLSAHILD